VSGFRLSEESEAELDDIWLYVARESGATEIATRIVDSITERFWFLAEHPYAGRRRDGDLRPGLRSFPAEGYVIIYRIEDETPVILHILHGSQDIASFFH
jgi:plasmid stabilization system protein ParE